MKRLISLVLAILLMLSLVACSGGKSAEEVDKILKDEGWKSSHMDELALDMDDFKIKEGLFATKGINTIYYYVFENGEDINRFKQQTPEEFNFKLKQSKNAVAVFQNMSNEEINQIAGKIGF